MTFRTSTFRYLMLAALLTLLGGASKISTHRELWSLTRLPIGHGQFISRFALKTFGVHILAVCQMPGGWTINAGNDGTPSGVIEGTAGVGVAYLAQPSPTSLRRFILVELDQFRPLAMGTVPPSVEGRAEVGRYGADNHYHWVRLKLESIERLAERQCPPVADGSS